MRRCRTSAAPACPTSRLTTTWWKLEAEKKAIQAAKLANKDTEWGKGDVRDETAALTSNE